MIVGNHPEPIQFSLLLKFPVTEAHSSPPGFENSGSVDSMLLPVQARLELGFWKKIMQLDSAGELVFLYKLLSFR